MCRLLLLLVLLISVPSNSQNSETGHENHIIESRVDSIINSIQKRGESRGYDLKSALLNLPTKNNYPVEWWYNIKVLDSISNSSGAVIGQVIWDETHWSMSKNWHFHARIELEQHLFGDMLLAEQTLAHEFGHILGLVHRCRKQISNSVIRQDCFNIMSPLQQIPPKGSMYYKIIYNSRESEEIWDLYFKKLKNLQN